MKSIKVLVLFTLLSNTIIFGQTLTQTLKGHIYEIGTNISLPGVHVKVLGSEKGAVTDDDGYFRIGNVPVGRATVKTSYLGYEQYTASEILVTSAKEINLTIFLVPSIEQLDQIVIKSKDKLKANNKSLLISARSFGLEETKRYPASISDPGRMALSFAGVTSSDDETNEIIIRGNAPNQLLWRIEGVEVPQPNHFSEEGYSPGAVSILSSNMLGKSDFITGAFSAEYGNAISGVFDIGLRNGNFEKKEYSFSAGVLGLDFSMEGPFSKNKKSSYLFNYRYSSLSLLNEIINISEGSIPEYQDLSFKINHELTDKTSLSIWGIGGISNEIEDEEIYNDYADSEVFESNTYMSGINLKHFINDTDKLNFGISYSGNGSDFKYKEHNLSSSYTYDAIDKLKNSALRFTTDYTKKVSSKSSFKIGGILSLLSYNVNSNFTKNGVNTTTVNEKGEGKMLQGFVQKTYRFNDKLSGSFGLHGTYFSINKQTTIEPRAALQWRLKPKHSLSFGFGVHSRKMPINQYFVQIEDNNNITTPNASLDLMKSIHYILGYDWRIIKNGRLKIEAYYQKMNNVAVVKDSNYTDSYINGGFINNELSDTGIGENYGLELTFEKFFSNQYYFLVTSSLFDTKYRASNNIWYNSKFNYNYTFNLVGGKEFTVGKEKNNILSINGKTLLSGGKLGTPINYSIFNQTGNIVVDQGLRNSKRLKNYFRIDLSFNYILNKPKTSHTLSLDLQNITNRNNVYSEAFDPISGEKAINYQLGLVPILKYQINF